MTQCLWTLRTHERRPAYFHFLYLLKYGPLLLQSHGIVLAVFCGWFCKCKPKNWALFWFSKSFLCVRKQFLYWPVHDVMTLLLFATMKSLILEHHHDHHHLQRRHHHYVTGASFVNPKMVSTCPKPYWPSLVSSHFTRPNGMSLVAGGLLTHFSGDFVNFVLKSYHLYSYVCNLQYVVPVRIS